MLEHEIETALQHNAFSPERICWFKKHFDGITATDETSSDYMETENSRNIRMVELDDRLKGMKEVGLSSDII